MKRTLLTAGLAVLLLVIAWGAYVLVRIGPRNVWGMLRYDQRQGGSLRVGDPAPDVRLVSLDAVSRVRLHERLGARPLVLVFGSYT
ncbi:MAG TPA: hypothetical protein VMT16_15865 [Thermoanaerobaculia bacterium]|nr:hypothetical protein [Thermoanaerobaculia bacterium]